MPRRLRLFAAVLVCLLASVGPGEAFPTDLPATTPLKGTTPAGWRIVWTDDPATTATVSWNTVEPGESHAVYFDTESRGGDRDAYSGRVECERNAPYNVGLFASLAGRRPALHYHHARLTDLSPSTTYYFVLASDCQTSAEMHFVTAPDEDRPFKLLFGGDSRSDHAARCQVNLMIADLLEEQPEILAMAHGGDYIVSGTSLSQWRDWMSHHELTTTKSGRVLPIIPARGNHDRGELINEVFGFPPRDRNFYAISIGSQCRFMTLNSETTTSGEQRDWLESELREAQSYRWILCQYHSPAWPAVKNPSRALKNWVPLFEQYDVDLVCEADGHTIKRTPPIRDGQRDESGVVYIGEGGLGVRPRTPKIDDRWWLQEPGKAGSGHHVQILTIRPDVLQYEVVLLEGRQTFDRATLSPRSRVSKPATSVIP